MDHTDRPVDGKIAQRWTEAQLARLLGLWNDRLSAARIARALGPGFTRSAVVGKLIRMGLRRTDEQRQEAQAAGARWIHSRRRAADHPPTPPYASLPDPTPCAVVPRLVDILELRRPNCRWPYPIGADVRFCGHPAKPGSSYCPEHHAIAYFAILPPLTLESLEGPYAPPHPADARGQNR